MGEAGSAAAIPVESTAVNRRINAAAEELKHKQEALSAVVEDAASFTSTIPAPFGGQVIRLLHPRGSFIREGQPLVVIVRRVVETPLWLALVPFGVPQLSRGDTAWGAWFLGSQALAGLASVGAFTWALTLPDASGRTTPDDLTFHDDWLLPTYLAAGITFYALVVWGVADGFLQAPDAPRVVEERREVLEPEAEGPPSPEAP